MLCYGILSPHPPIILPQFGSDEEHNEVKATIKALEEASHGLGKAKPEKVIIISPHDEHGFKVPFYFLGRHLSPTTEVEEILVTEPSYDYYYDLGKEYRNKVMEDKKRIAIIASGDLSHVLKEDGPYGFDPTGPKLDKIIVEAIKKKDLKALRNIDNETLEHGAECGLRSIIFLMSAFEEINYVPNVLSYEGPFGVGYCVATFEPKEDK